MAWEKRQRGEVYYTRSRKVGGRVVREYVGGGAAGLRAHQEDQARRRQKEEAKEREAHFADLDRMVADLHGKGEELVQVELVLGGYHQHDGGEWRKWRGKQSG